VLENDLLVVRLANVTDVVAAAGPGAALVGDSIVVTRGDVQAMWSNVIGEVMNGFLAVSAAADAVRSGPLAELSLDEVDRRRSNWAETPILHNEMTIAELRSTQDLRAVLAAPLVVFGS
jgi:hypothetical protein